MSGTSLSIDQLTKDVRNFSPSTPSRNHRRESSVASAMVRTLKENLTEDMSKICESYLSTKLSAKFRKVAQLEKGRAGTRPIYLTKHGKELCGFEFNSSAPYKKVFKAKYHVHPGSRKGQVILHFPSFIPDKELKRPEEATNFKINARLVALSDFGYDTIEDEYTPLNKEYHGRCASYESGMLPLLKMPIDPITTQLSLDQKALPQGTSVFLLMSVSFYKYEKGHFHHLCKESSMQIEQVF